MYMHQYNIAIILLSLHVLNLSPFNVIKVKNGSYEEPYTDPGAPVHIVSGAAVSELLN